MCGPSTQPEPAATTSRENKTRWAPNGAPQIFAGITLLAPDLQAVLAAVVVDTHVDLILDALRSMSKVKLGLLAEMLIVADKTWIPSTLM
ncbi:hypothetical protein ACTU45_31145 [Streptomyces sp. 24-1644]|uniref:hypothetical protein n=1 Tax=Streptomyces sp. 24-1644 TaxID=3457315 RepID=UPI003FA751EF